jgi:lipopolysaccharide export system protein LptA
MKRIPLIAVVLIAFLPSLFAQEADPVSEVEAAGRNILSDPRLKNVLRNVKPEPGASVEEMAANPDAEQAVREATRIFQEKTNGIDAETLKAAAAQAKNEGLLDQAAAKAGEVVNKAAAATRPPAAKPASAPATTATPAAATPEVPATRPAPGISGGAPTPVAMPVASGTPLGAGTPVASGTPAVTATPIATGAPVPAGAPVIPAADTPAAPRPAEPLPSAVAAATGRVVQESRAEPIAGAAPTTPMIPELPDLGPNAIPAPVPLSKQFQKGANGAYPSADRRHMEILAKESIMDNTKGVLLFTGNVFIDHPDFEIKCDKLEIQLAEGVGMEGSEESEESGANFKRAIASGGMVEIKRLAKDEKGRPKTQIAIARIADYNATTKDIVLSGGPPYIQDGDRFVKTNSEDSKIIMRGNGLYEITGSTNRVQIVIPIENKDAKGKKGEVGLPGGLEGSFDRFR